mmetsp:Transcript_123233/g.354099  ORF Transcript_123233/g.354099 Transcript_123233/m.354099 type:complete len:224 (-) Transcript_123233:415-1086(-)
MLPTREGESISLMTSWYCAKAAQIAATCDTVRSSPATSGLPTLTWMCMPVEGFACTPRCVKTPSMSRTDRSPASPDSASGGAGDLTSTRAPKASLDKFVPNKRFESLMCRDSKGIKEQSQPHVQRAKAALTTPGAKAPRQHCLNSSAMAASSSSVLSSVVSSTQGSLNRSRKTGATRSNCGGRTKNSSSTPKAREVSIANSRCKRRASSSSVRASNGEHCKCA